MKTKEKFVAIRLSEEEHEKLKVLAKNNKTSISEYIRDMVLNEGCSLLQLRIMLSDMNNTLSNILLAQKILAANTTEMFRNVSTRITVGDRNPSTIPQDEADKINKGIENSINRVKTAAMDAVFKHYTDIEGDDPVGLDVFAERLEKF